MTEDENLATMLRLAASYPGIVPRFDGWEGAVGLVTEAEYQRITAQARRERRWYMAREPYLDCWFVWVGDLPKANRLECGARVGKSAVKLRPLSEAVFHCVNWYGVRCSRCRDN